MLEPYGQNYTKQCTASHQSKTFKRTRSEFLSKLDMLFWNINIFIYNFIVKNI